MIHFPAGRRVRSMPFIHGLRTSAIGPAIRIRWETEPLAREVAGNVERAALGMPDERCVAACREPSRLRQRDVSGGEVGVDVRCRFTV